MKLKVLSYNIWIDGYFEKVTAFLKSSGADIIGLQEVVPGDPNRDVIGFLGKLGYGHVFAPVAHTRGSNIYNDGPALFSKIEIAKSETYMLSKKDSRAAAKAEINVGGRTLNVFSTHLIHSHQKHSKIQDEQVTNLIKQLSPERTIVMGDFNATSDSTVVKAMRSALVDTDPSSQPTWSVYPKGCIVCNPQAINTKLDYIFTSKDIKTSSFEVENSKGSDHLPISVIIEI